MLAGCGEGEGCCRVAGKTVLVDRDRWMVAALFTRGTGRVGGGVSYRLIV